MAKRRKKTVDPTRTSGLRRRYLGDIGSRYGAVRRALRDLIDTQDALGIKDPLTGVFPPGARRWEFQSNPDKVQSFRTWLQGEVEAGELIVDPGTNPEEYWASQYIESAHKKGDRRAYIDAKAAAGEIEDITADQLEKAFRVRTRTDTLQLLYSRNFTDLQGVTTSIDAELSRGLTEGLSRGESPRVIARTLQESLDGNRKRAERIARTEVVHAHAEGQLDSFERMGVEEITVYAEWRTAGDERVCPKCSSIDGVVLTIREARGLLPRHPNCRCAWLPAFPDMKFEGDKRTDKQITSAINKSVVKERQRRRTVKAARRASRWKGADLEQPKDKRTKQRARART